MLLSIFSGIERESNGTSPLSPQIRGIPILEDLRHFKSNRHKPIDTLTVKIVLQCLAGIKGREGQMPIKSVLLTSEEISNRGIQISACTPQLLHCAQSLTLSLVLVVNAAHKEAIKAHLGKKMSG